MRNGHKNADLKNTHDDEDHHSNDMRNFLYIFL